MLGQELRLLRRHVGLRVFLRRLRQQDLEREHLVEERLDELPGADFVERTDLLPVQQGLDLVHVGEAVSLDLCGQRCLLCDYSVKKFSVDLDDTALRINLLAVLLRAAEQLDARPARARGTQEPPEGNFPLWRRLEDLWVTRELIDEA